MGKTSSFGHEVIFFGKVYIMQSLYPYTPRKMPFADLKFTFVGREPLLDELMDSVGEQATKERLQHWMIIGTRGMGKSHIITMIYHMVKQDELMKESWVPVLMNEEEQGIFSLHTLFIRILTKLSEELIWHDRQQSDEIIGFLNALREGKKTQAEILDAAVAYIKDYAVSSGRRLLILMENTDDIFSRYLPKKNEVKQFRNILQHDNFMLLLATSPTFFEGISKSKAPLYDFFRLRRLDLLDYDQAVELLNKWVYQEKKSKDKMSVPVFKKDDYKLKVLYHLTGGNPRILLFLYMAVTGEVGIKNAVDTFSRLLEEDLSNYYLNRMRDLSNQVQPIVLALAESEYNLTQTAIARQTFLPAKSIGTAIVRLEKDGIVKAVTEKKGKNTLYALTDQLFRLWYRWRTSVRDRHIIEAVVEFLAIWYRKRELMAMASNDDPAGIHSREALSFRDTEKFKGYWESFHIESEIHIQEYLKQKDYASLFETLELLDETGYRVDTFVQSAVNEIEEKDGLDKAQSFLRDKIKDDPAGIDAYLALDSILIREKDYVGAEEILKKALRIAPKNIIVWNNLGAARLRQENYPGAVEAFSRCVKLDPKNRAAWDNLGAVRFQQENYPGAEEALSKSVKLDPKSRESWDILGAARFQQENYSGAEEAYSKSVKLDPKNGAAWSILGAARLRQENYPGAEEAYSKSVKLDPKNGAIWWNLGLALLRQENYPGVEEALSKSVELDPKNVKAWISLGFARWRQENYPGAEEPFANSVNLDPKIATIWEALGIIRFMQQNHSGAEEAIVEAIKLTPTALSLYSIISVDLIEDSRTQDLLDILKKTLSKKAIGREFKAYINLLQAAAFLLQEDRTPFLKSLNRGLNLTKSLEADKKHLILGELSDLLVEIIQGNNLKVIEAFIIEIRSISTDIAAIFNPLNHVLKYYNVLLSNQKNPKAAADRAQRVLDSLTSEIKGPVEEMVARVRKNINYGSETKPVKKES